MAGLPSTWTSSAFSPIVAFLRSTSTTVPVLVGAELDVAVAVAVSVESSLSVSDAVAVASASVAVASITVRLRVCKGHWHSSHHLLSLCLPLLRHPRHHRSPSRWVACRLKLGKLHLTVEQLLALGHLWQMEHYLPVHLSVVRLRHRQDLKVGLGQDLRAQQRALMVLVERWLKVLRLDQE